MNLRVADFKIPEELDAYKEAVRKFAREVLDPLAQRIDIENDANPDEVRLLLKEAGFIALPCPKEYGGFGLPTDGVL